MKRAAMALGVYLCLAGSVGHAAGIANREFKRLEKQLKRAAKQGARDEAVHLLGSIGEDDSERAFRLIQSLGSRTPSPRIYAAAAEAIGAMRSAEVHNAIVAELRKAKPKPGTFLLLDALAAAGTRDASDSLTLLFESRDPALVRGAVASLPDDALDAVPALIELLAACEETSERLHLRGLAATKLHTITRKCFPDAASWRAFWKESGPGFKRVTLPGADPLELPYATGTLFGEPVASERLLVLLDVSSSMDTKRTEPLGVRPGPRKPLAGAETRFDYAKEGVRQLVRSLSPKVRFNLVGYSGTMMMPRSPDGDPFELPPANVPGTSFRWFTPWSRKLVGASESNAAELTGFLGKLRTTPGGTFTLSALRHALRDESVDTVLLISDGASSERNRSTGNELDADDVLSVFRHANRKRRVVVHTFGFGVSASPPRRRRGFGRSGPSDPFGELMRGLARQTGGRCVSLR